MNDAAIKKHDVANGPGVRVSLFVSGCEHYCKDCFNSEAWDFSYGKPFTEKTEREISAALAPPYIKGFSLLGGEPFHPANQDALLPLLRKIKSEYPEKDIWCYTGYVYEDELLGDGPAATKTAMEMLKNIDVLVDGRFEEKLKNLSLRFRGSENQRIIDLKASRAIGKTVLWSGMNGTVSFEK